MPQIRPIKDISLTEIPEPRPIPNPVLPKVPPITTWMDIPTADLPVYDALDLTPGITPPVSPKPTMQPAEEKKLEGVSIPPVPSLNEEASQTPSPSMVETKLPCPPPDAIPLGARNRSQTAVVIGYERDGVTGTCEPILKPLDVPTIIGNYLPGAPVIFSTAAIAAMATTVAVASRPLGDVVLKIVKPTVKKVTKMILKRKGERPIALRDRILAQRDRNRAILALRRSLKP